jgi:NADPH:quinone reductase-like Zn-dependent oxidoreductase
MKAALVMGPGQTPVYGDYEEPSPMDGEYLVTVTAAALSRLARGRASGSHYSASGSYPLVVGVDGVGKLDDGRRVYFILPRPPFGGMSEKTVVKSSQCVFLPDGLGNVEAAAIANPGMSCWGAFKERAKLQAGETVLVNGATGSAGRLAVQVAKYLGAKKIIATGRNPESLRTLKTLGADVTIPLVEDAAALEDAFKEQFNLGIDVVLDYVWGPSAERLLAAAAKAVNQGRRLRYVHVGATSGSENISLPGATLRSIPLEIMGSGLGSIPGDRIVENIGALLNVTKSAGFEVATRSVPLAKIAEAWASDTGMPRTVVTL